MTGTRVPYAGVATRAIALAIDAAIINAVVFGVGAVFALVGSLVADVRLDALAKLLVGAGWAASVGCYFVVFWSTAGQTPAMRLMELRVLAADGEPPHAARSLLRLIGLGLAIVPLFAGFLPVLVDDRRRGLHDFLAGTVVIHGDVGPASVAQPAAAAVRAGYSAPV